MSALKDISKILVSELEGQTLLQQVLDYLVHKLEAADVGIVWVYDPSTSRLIAEAASGIDLNTLKQSPLDAGDAVVGRVLRTGQSEVYRADVVAEATSDSTEATAQKIFGIEIPDLNSPAAVVCLPLIVREAKSGVMMLLNLKSGAGFNSNDVLFLQGVANLVALAIESAGLRKEPVVKQVIGTDERHVAELISTLAHEMRTPLTSIKGYSTALLIEEVSFDPKKQREFLEIIDKECDVLQALISDFLESSALDAGAIKIDRQPVRLDRLATEAANDLARRFPEHRLVVDFPSEFPLVDADPDRIMEVIRQLLDNAAKYSPKGGLIVLQGRTNKDEVVISVADEGVGIAPDDLNRIFEKYFRAKFGTATHIIGTGLGLPISRAIVETHGGRIWAESQLGQGTVFHFALPLKGPSQDAAE